MKIFLEGHKSLVGSEKIRKIKKKKYNNIITADRKNLDLLNQRAVFSFLRKKNSAQEYSFSKDQIAIVKNNSLNLILGKINFKDNQPIIYTKYNFDLDNLRVVLND